MKLQNDQGQTTDLEIREDIAEFYGEEYQILMHDGEISRAGHISVNNLVVKDEYIDEVANRFETRNGRVDQYAGFEGFMLLRNNNKFSVLTGWENREKYDAWVSSEGFQNSHQKKEDRVNKEGSDFLVEKPIRDHYEVIA